MKTVIGLMLLVMSGQAVAGWYIGAGLGRAAVDIEDVSVPGVDITYNDTDVSGKIFGGYKFNKGLAVEAAYADLGLYEMTARSGFNYAKVSMEIEALSIAVMGILPLNERVGLFVKAGIASWHMDDTLTSNVGVYEKNSYSGTEPVAGVGVHFNVKRATFAVQMERYLDIGDEENTGQTDVDVIGVSASLNF